MTTITMRIYHKGKNVIQVKNGCRVRAKIERTGSVWQVQANCQLYGAKDWRALMPMLTVALSREYSLLGDTEVVITGWN